MLGAVLLVLLVVVAAGMAWIRFAPIDPARWHVDIAAEGFVPKANAAYCPATGGLAASTLSALDAVAMATPRTTRLAGSVAEGHVTWVTRSARMAYPDYTTAQIKGDRLCVIARQGIGREDLGVNAARLGAWLQEVGGLAAPPALVWE